MTGLDIDLRRAGQRFSTSTPWVTSRHSFSFGEHYDPDNVGYGPLLVSNEEVVSSGFGFDDHPHANAEIVTWVLSGSLVHRDSTGHVGVVRPGLAQRLSAGAGVVHSERNDVFRIAPSSPPEPAHYVQMWLRPDESGGPSSYQQSEVDVGGLSSGWVPIASGKHPDAAMTLRTRGSTLWGTILAAGVQRVLPSGPMLHLYVARGQLDLESVGALAVGDSARLRGDAALRLSGRSEAEILVWEMTE